MTMTSSRGGKKMWCVGQIDDEYVERMADLLNLYEKPRDPDEPVVCLDEKPIQLLSEVREPVPVRPGKPKRRDNEYVRNGTANVFCAIEPKAGKHITRVTNRRAARDFAGMVKEIATKYPEATTIHLVMDNLSTHKEKSLIDSLGPKLGTALWQRFTPHYTPKHGSWLNQAEIEISMYSRTCLGKERIPSQSALIKRTKAWKRDMNRRQVSICWKFTMKKAREKFKLDDREEQSPPSGGDNPRRARH
jgi:transposase